MSAERVLWISISVVMLVVLVAYARGSRPGVLLDRANAHDAPVPMAGWRNVWRTVACKLDGHASRAETVLVRRDGQLTRSHIEAAWCPICGRDLRRRKNEPRHQLGFTNPDRCRCGQPWPCLDSVSSDRKLEDRR